MRGHDVERSSDIKYICLNGCVSQDYMAILSVCTVIPSLVGTRGPSAGQYSLPSAPLSQSVQHGYRPAHPINWHSPRGGEESRVWVRGLTCTRNNGFYLAGAREPWLFGVLCGCWVACGILYTREATCKTRLFHSHNAGGSKIALEIARAGYIPRRFTCGIDLRCLFSLTIDVPMPWSLPPYTRLACSARTCGTCPATSPLWIGGSALCC